MSLLEVKKQITSTQNTKKITKAMQLVAASKMKSFQKKSRHVRDFTGGIVQQMRATGGSLSETVFAEQRAEGKVLFILVTSDKGLCGAMNARLVRKLFQQSQSWQDTPASDRLLMTIGRKSVDAAKRENAPVHSSFQNLPEDMNPLKSLEVIDAILALWLSGEVREVQLISPRYVNPFVFHSQSRTYLPLSESQLDRLLSVEDVEGTEVSEVAEDAKVIEAAFMEPSRSAVVETLSERMIQSLFIEAFFELKATEYSSRMVAMKKATEAAEDRIKELTRAYNKARQAAITSQLSELAAANEAMSGANKHELNLA